MEKHSIWDGHSHVKEAMPALGNLPEGETWESVDIRDIIPPTTEELREGMGEELYEEYLQFIEAAGLEGRQ